MGKGSKASAPAQPKIVQPGGAPKGTVANPADAKGFGKGTASWQNKITTRRANTRTMAQNRFGSRGKGMPTSPKTPSMTVRGKATAPVVGGNAISKDKGASIKRGGVTTKAKFIGATE